MRTPLAEVRGLGSAKEGTGEFIAQRVTSVALILLLGFFLVLLVSLVGAPQSRVVAVIANPFVAIILVAGILVTVIHMRVGMQVIIEDYVHADMAKFALLIGNWLFAWGVGLVAVFAVLRIAFAG
jgi:succinate dehydrogenase / fumarate reductase, membrane anchor subunit